MAAVNRYSTIVSWVKVTLPLIAIGLLSTLFLLSRTPDPDAAIPFADVDVEDIASTQRLSQPRFAGTLEDGREVTLVADAAVPSSDEANVIFVEGVEARIELSPVDFLIMNADDGTVDMAAQEAELAGAVRIVTSRGYRLAADLINMALGRLEVASPGQVEVQGPGFDLTAGAMQLSGPGESAVLSFTGGVRLLYEPEG